MAMFSSGTLKVFRYREFRFFVVARLLMTLAVQMQFSTLYLQVYYEHSREEFMLGLMGLAEAVPFILTSLVSGHYADKLGKRGIIISCNILLVISSVFLYLNSEASIALLKNLGVVALFGIVFFFGIIRSFIAATANPYLSQLVPRDQYTSSATWNSTAWHTGAILGPVVSGVIYGYHGALNASACHLVEAFLLTGSLICFLMVRHPGQPHNETINESIFESLKLGLNFVFGNKMVLSAISLDLFAVLFGGAVALIPAFTDKVLHFGPEAYGLLRTAPAIGALFMALVMVIVPPSHKAGLALIWSVVAFGVFTILFAISTNYWVAFLMLFCTGAFDNVSVVVRHSILQLMTPDNMRGRVSAINSVFIGSSNEIGAFESGVAAKFLGLVPSIIFGGAMTIVVVLGIDRWHPALKKLDITKYN